MRYVRAEKDAILRDTYFGKELDWERATGKEWFWKWHGRYETTRVTFSNDEIKELVNLPGLVEGGKQYVAVSYFPHRSLWANSAVEGFDQAANLTLSGANYKKRMDSGAAGLLDTGYVSAGFNRNGGLRRRAGVL